MKDWSPELYLKFNNERTQPSIDLVNRIKINWQPDSIIDIGCGPGNSSQVLHMRWPDAKLLGIDLSQNMIDKARKDYPDSEWIVADASKFVSDKKFDIVFSNATIQWIPDHGKLLKKFKLLLTQRGILAFQIPPFRDIALGKIIEETGKSSKWRDKTGHCAKLFTYHDYAFYYDLLTTMFETIELWETHYIHIMESHQAIIEWSKSTGLKPYLDSLDNESQREEFVNDILENIVKAYPIQENGKVLFPFKRLFVIAYMKADSHWSSLINSLDKFSDDFMESRPTPETQKMPPL